MTRRNARGARPLCHEKARIYGEHTQVFYETEKRLVAGQWIGTLASVETEDWR